MSAGRSRAVPSADFTSSSFLGYRHSHADLAPWRYLSTGVPAGLREDRLATRVAAALAAGHGSAAGLVSASTLHALSDIFGELPRPGDLVAVDEFAYPITQWAVLRAAAKGAVVVRYPHHHPEHLRLAQVPGQRRPSDRRVFMATDGWCPGCNQPAPLARLQRFAAQQGGQLVVDDTLACGILGRRQGTSGGFGDGTGTMRWAGLDHRCVVWVASLAKAFGSPLAVTTGDRTTMRCLAQAGTRWHSSPPSAAELRAAASAVLDPVRSAAARSALYRKVLRLCRSLRSAGLSLAGQPFPLVSVPMPSAEEALRWHAELARRGVVTFVQASRCRPGSVLSALVRADHQPAELSALAAGLVDMNRSRRATGGIT